VITIGALLLSLLLMEVSLRRWLRASGPDEAGPAESRPQRTRPPDGTGHRALLAAEATAVHRLLDGQIDTAAYHQQMHELACREELTRGAPS